MNEVEFDEALSSFLRSNGCERVGDAACELIRSAFTAGWAAAMDSNMKIEKRRAEEPAWTHGAIFAEDGPWQGPGFDRPL